MLILTIYLSSFTMILSLALPCLPYSMTTYMCVLVLASTAVLVPFVQCGHALKMM